VSRPAGHIRPPISAARLHRWLDAAACFGHTPAGGVCRLAASREDGAARDWLRARLEEEGFRVAVDAIGNMFGVLDLAGPGAPCVFTGSHLDSQPTGGRYDGAYGVIGGIEAALAVRHLVATRHGRPTRNLAVVNWTNEEGARFAPSTLGSVVFAGLVDLDVALSSVDADGLTLGEALAAIGYRGTDAPPQNVAAYVELHIEQGPELKRHGRTIGVVEGNWGTVKYVVEITGEAAHTGSTPMAKRRDALLPAAELVLFCRRLSDQTGGALLSSVGRLDIEPNSTNVVAGRVRLFVEFRDIGPGQLTAACAAFEAKAHTLSTPGVSVALTRTVNRHAGAFDAALRDLIEDVARDYAYPTLRLHTIAGHDAIPLKARCPSGMIFVPSADGVSHNEAEFTAPKDLEAGVEVLAGVLWRLVQG
jgi:N-carbamoyl-L-amino-acid hydrolase